MTNQELINKFFEAYINHNFYEITEVMSENVTWTFLGKHKLAGVKNGINEVVMFFDTMGEIMSNSKPLVQKLIVGESDKYILECQHIKTNRDDGINIEHEVCVLWSFENGKIISGKHFFSDPKAVDSFFNSVSN